MTWSYLAVSFEEKRQSSSWLWKKKPQPTTTTTTTTKQTNQTTNKQTPNKLGRYLRFITGFHSCKKQWSVLKQSQGGNILWRVHRIIEDGIDGGKAMLYTFVQQWMKLNRIVKAELCICMNIQTMCGEFFKQIQTNKRKPAATTSSLKYFFGD